MKSLSLFLAVTLLTLAGCEKHQTSELHLVTLNVRYDNPDDGENRWANRIPIVESYLREEAPDIIGMQEVLHNQLLDLRQMLPGYGYVGTGRDDGSTSGEYAPIFWREDRFDLVDYSQFWLSETPDSVGSRGWDAAFPRIVTWAALQDNQSGRIIYAFNTHFDHRGRDARMNSISLMADRMSDIAGDDPVIAMGDFNIRKNHPAFGDTLYNHITEIFIERDELQNAEYTAAEVVSAGATGNGFNESWRDRPPHAIDFIFADTNFEVQTYRVDHIIQNGIFISDHWPVVSVVNFRGTSTE
jgi:endonuclease/exonuclease/phosphatase family metal-dependent hydrolase